MIPYEVLASGDLIFEGMSSDASEEDWSIISDQNKMRNEASRG